MIFVVRVSPLVSPPNVNFVPVCILHPYAGLVLEYAGVLECWAGVLLYYYWIPLGYLGPRSQVPRSFLLRHLWNAEVLRSLFVETPQEFRGTSTFFKPFSKHSQLFLQISQAIFLN